MCKLLGSCRSTIGKPRLNAIPDAALIFYREIAQRTFQLALLNNHPPSLKEKIFSWRSHNGVNATQEKTAESDINRLSREVGDDHKLNGLLKECSALPGIYATIKTSEAYRWLIASFAQLLSSDWQDCETFFLVRESVLAFIDRDDSVPQSFQLTSLEIDWELAEFIQSQYKAQPNFIAYARMPVLCGTFPDVELLSWIEYVRSLWPRTSSVLLVFVDAYMEAQRAHLEKAQTTSHEVSITAQLTPHKTVLKITGSLLAVSDVAEALIWLSAACRMSSSPNSVAHCRPAINLQHLSCSVRHIIDIIPESETGNTFGKDEEEEEDDDYDSRLASCWRQMFRNPAIAQGYPIPRRHHSEHGLGIGLGALSTISAAPLLTRFDGKLLMKGAISMLVPVVQTATSIIWHFVRSDKEWLPYSAMDACKATIIAAEEDVVKHRHYVGWTTRADHLAGMTFFNIQLLKVHVVDLT